MRAARCLPSVLGFSLLLGVSLRISAQEPAGPLAEKLKTTEVTRHAVAPGYAEGPTWRDGEVFFCSGGLWQVRRDGTTSKYFDISPAGTFLRRDKQMLICDNKFKALLVLTNDGRLGVLAEKQGTEPLNSLNDVTVDAKGNIYWSDPSGSSANKRVGKILRLTPAGVVSVIADDLAFPNGLDVDPASKHLYVIESQSQKVLRYPLPADDAVLGAAEEFYDLGGSGGDGCAFDAQGNIWVADFHRKGETDRGRITVLSPQAKVLGYLDLPTRVVSNITFGGEDLDEIFCTTGTPPGVYRAKVGVKGFAGHPGAELKIVRYLDVKPE